MRGIGFGIACVRPVVLHHPLLDGPARVQVVHGHLAGLPDAVNATGRALKVSYYNMKNPAEWVRLRDLNFSTELDFVTQLLI